MSRKGLWSALQTHLQGVDGTTLAMMPEVSLHSVILLSRKGCRSEIPLPAVGGKKNPCHQDFRWLDAPRSLILRCSKGEAGALTPMAARSSVGACPSRLRPSACAPQDEGGWRMPRA
ncbi:hypothetical protein B5K05_08230 [Rhizobium phaseoli]|nr:hypothetical protein CO651_20600 [Rhizobium phaseoli]RDJ14289.1 hypothetical protein B5K04_08195 [Rhizobium phaseoli]RDJ17424.1 hypothetical protein B5K05_08230 [Rhizobium phaseoli]